MPAPELRTPSWWRSLRQVRLRAPLLSMRISSCGLPCLCSRVVPVELVAQQPKVYHRVASFDVYLHAARALRCLNRDTVHTGGQACPRDRDRSEEHTSELQSLAYLVCRL